MQVGDLVIPSVEEHALAGRSFAEGHITTAAAHGLDLANALFQLGSGLVDDRVIQLMEPALTMAQELGLLAIGVIVQLDLEEVEAGDVGDLGRVDMLLELRAALLERCHHLSLDSFDSKPVCRSRV